MATPRQTWVRLSVAALALAALAALAVSLADVIPRHAITPTAMAATSRRIELYYLRNKRLPPDLSVLPVRDNYDSRTTDAWKRPLRYAIESEVEFSLLSFGEDGVAGGAGDSADVVRRYRMGLGQLVEVP
jgi:hypothetical protein